MCACMDYSGVDVGNEFCNRYAETSPVPPDPVIDHTLWTLTTAVHNVTLGSGTGTQEDSISDNNYSVIITTVCTVLAFILGIICGLIAYHFVSVLWGKRKGKQKKSNAIYDEVTPHHNFKCGESNVQMELSENVAYGQV